MPIKFIEKKILCTICARGSSKGVPHKNILPIAGLPLIAHSLKQAKESNCFLAIAVSSDCDIILQTAMNYGANYIIKRPKELASDTSGKIPAIIHCVQEAEKLTNTSYDIFADLDATSPLRTSDDIVNTINLLLSKNAENVITGCKARRSPYFNLVEEKGDGRVGLSKKSSPPVLRRQDAPNCYDMNSSIYVWQRKALLERQGIFLDKTYLYEMPPERSIDIDSHFDLKIVRIMLEGTIQ